MRADTPAQLCLQSDECVRVAPTISEAGTLESSHKLGQTEREQRFRLK